MHWLNPAHIPSFKYTCGYCSSEVASERGFIRYRSQSVSEITGLVVICHHCSSATYFYGFDLEKQVPLALPGSDVAHTPDEVSAIYMEARKCLTINGSTACVMLCRKILMNTAVDKGAEEGLRFTEYVKYLAKSGYIPPGGEKWVDLVREIGNEANHELKPSSVHDAKLMLKFIENLLTVVYDLPGSAHGFVNSRNEK